MELRQLRYFREICHTGSFTQAATNLFVAQPVITNALHKLEDELKVQLLNRTNKAVTLTAEGRLLLEKSEALLSLADEVYREITDFNYLSSGSIRLGIPAQIGNYLFPRIFGEFNLLYPHLNLVASEIESGKIVSLLEKDDLDIGIVVLSDNLSTMRTKFLFNQNVLLCVAEEHPLRLQKSVSFPDLQNERFIMRMPGARLRDIIIDQCKKNGFIPNIVFSSSQIQTIKTLVSRNIGISFLMELSVLDDPSIFTVPMATSLNLNIGLVWKKGRYVSKSTQTFIDYMISTFHK